MKFSSKLLALFVILPIVAVLGCTAGRLYEIGPKSHFVHPNSNVKTLGPVVVKKSGNVTLGHPSIRTGKDDLELYNKALAQVPEANVIIDYFRVTDAKYPLIPFIFWTETKFEGTAARVTVGEQELR